jgi:predicted ester cyclase
MSTPIAKELATQWFQRVWQQGSREAIFDLMSPTATGVAEGGLKIQGPEEFARLHDQFFAAFPDLTLEILHSVGDDKEASVHWKVCGTQQGAFGPVPATREPVCFTGMTYLVVDNGRIVEGWDCWDQGSVIGALMAKATEDTSVA